MTAPIQGSRAHGPTIVLGLFALTLLLFTKSEPVSWSDASRMGSIQAVVEHGTLALDETAFLHQGDRVRLGGPLSKGGHFYSHQPPMLAILGALPYGVLHLFGRAIDDPGTYRIVTLSVVGLPLLVGLHCLLQLMQLAGASQRDATWLLAAAAFGNLALPYALVLNQHGTAAGLVMVGLLQVQRQRYLSAGIALSVATTVDLTALFFALALLLPIVRSGQLPALARYAAAAVPALVVHFSINYAVVGDFTPLALHAEAFEYPRSPFQLMRRTGEVDASDAISQAEYALGAFLGASGLFSHHPVLLFALGLGLWSLREPPRHRDTSGRRAGALAPSLDHAILLGSASIGLYYLVESRNFGGSAFGMRWFCVFAPSLLLLPVSWQGKRPGRRLPIAIFAPLLVWSMAAASLGAIQPWMKVTYFWQNTERGRMALQRGEQVPPIEHWERQLRRLLRAGGRFDEARYERDYLWLLDDYRRAYLLPRPDLAEAERRASIEMGLARLERAVAVMDEEQIETGSRAWAHYWRAQFYRQLGRQAAAERDIETALELNPEFYESPFFDGVRRARLEAQEGRRP